MSFPLRPPFRARSQTQSQSHLPYKTIPEFHSDTPISGGSRWRSGEREPKQKWFILVQYGQEFVIGGRERRVEYDEDSEGGCILMGLQNTAHQQIVQLLSHLQLPSPFGLSLHLILSDSKYKPKLTEEIWSTFFSTYHSATPSQNGRLMNNDAYGGLPIVAKVLLKIEYSSARWYKSWKNASSRELVGDPIYVNSSRIAIDTCGSVERRLDKDLDKEESNQFTDSPFDLSVVEIPTLEVQTVDINYYGHEENIRRESAIDFTEPPKDRSKQHLSSAQIPNQVETINLPPLCAFSSSSSSDQFKANLQEIHNNNSNCSTPLSFHSIPYSPLHTLPDPEALSSQPFLKELYQTLHLIQSVRSRSDSDLAKRRGKESLTINTQKEEVRPPWADLGSAMWSVGTSWGPPSTPDGWDLSPSQRNVGRAEADLQVGEEDKVDQVGDAESRDSALSSQHPKGTLPEEHDNSHETILDEQHHHPNWTFLPNRQITPTPWKFGWPYHTVQNLPLTSPHLILEDQDVDSGSSNSSPSLYPEIILNVVSPAIPHGPSSPLQNDHIDFSSNLQVGRLSEYDPTSPFDLDIPISPCEIEDQQTDGHDNRDRNGLTVNLIQSDANESFLEFEREDTDFESSSLTTTGNERKESSNSLVIHAFSRNTIPLPLTEEHPSSPTVSLPQTDSAEKAIPIIIHQAVYPDLVIYPRVLNQLSISKEARVSIPKTISINLAVFEYPDIVIYPSRQSSHPKNDGGKDILPIPILSHQVIYPNITIYPASNSAVSIQLINYRYPDIVIYPCLDKGVHKIRTEMKKEAIHQATRYPIRSISTPNILPSRPSTRLRRRSSSLKISLDDINVPSRAVRMPSHNRGSSSISTISSSATVVVTTPTLVSSPALASLHGDLIRKNNGSQVSVSPRCENANGEILDYFH